MEQMQDVNLYNSRRVDNCQLEVSINLQRSERLHDEVIAQRYFVVALNELPEDLQVIPCELWAGAKVIEAIDSEDVGGAMPEPLTKGPSIRQSCEELLSGQ